MRLTFYEISQRPALLARMTVEEGKQLTYEQQLEKLEQLMGGSWSIVVHEPDLGQQWDALLKGGHPATAGQHQGAPAQPSGAQKTY